MRNSNGVYGVTYRWGDSLTNADLVPEAPAPTRYQGTMHLLPVVEGNRTFIEWAVTLDTEPKDAERWRTQFQSWIPDWTLSLERALDRLRT